MNRGIMMVEGFEHETYYWTNSSWADYGVVEVESQYRRSGIRGAHFTGIWHAYRDLPRGANHVTMGVALRSLAAPSGTGGVDLFGLYFEDGSLAARVYLAWTGGSPSVYNLKVQAGNTTSADIPRPDYCDVLYPAESPWNYYELRVNYYAQEVELQMNGRQIFSSDVSWSGTPGPVKYLRLGTINQSLAVDDIYVLEVLDPSTQFLGPISVLGSTPTDTLQQQWDGWQFLDNARETLEPTYLTVNERSANEDDTYIAADTPNNTELFQFWETEHQVVDPIYSLSLAARADKSEAIDCSIGLLGVVSGQEQLGEAHFPSFKSWQTVDDTWNESPLGSAWTWTQASTEGFGVRVLTLEA